MKYHVFAEIQNDMEKEKRTEGHIWSSAELVPVRAIRPTLELSAPGLPPTLLKESLRARLPSLAWVLPGLRACLGDPMGRPSPEKPFCRILGN